LVTGSADQTARLWQAATGRPLGAPFRHQNWVVSVAFRPDGRYILTGSTDKTARLWEVAPAPVEGAAERIVLWTQVLTGREVDPSGAVHVLDGATWRRRRGRLREQGGPPVSPPGPGEPARGSPELIAWHRQEAETCERERQWFGAAFHLSHLMDLQPEPGRLHARRARAYGQLGLWQKATRDYTKATATAPNDSWLAQEHAGVLLLCGDTEGYRRFCALLLQRFGRTTDPRKAYAVARTLLLVPGAGPDAARAAELAAKAVAADPKVPFYLHTLGLAHYRAGQYEPASRRLHECLKAHPWWAPGVNWLVLALAYQRQGKADEARQCLDKALRWSDRLAQNLPPGAANAVHLHMHDWLAYHLLRREAEARIKGSNPTSKKCVRTRGQNREREVRP
jgi:Flp pilus assembly protein TadD